MSAYNNLDEAIKGMKADSGFDRVESWNAYENIDFGVPCFTYIGEESQVATIKRDVGKIVFDADFVASNVITITVNGEDAADVTFDTDHDTTAAAVVTAVKAITLIDANGNSYSPDCILDPSDTDNRTFLIRTKWNDATVAEAITGGGSQATGTITYLTDMIFVGVAVHWQKDVYATNNARYAQYDPVNVMTRGVIWVETSKAVNANDDAYVIETGTNQDLFTDSSSSSVSVNSKFRDTISVAGLSKLEVKGQYKPNTEIIWA